MTGGIVQNDLCDPSQVRSHRLDTYCPWCQDPLSENTSGLRPGAEFAEIETPILDDRAYKRVLALHPESGGSLLLNVVRASDLVKAVDGPMFCLVRSGGDPSMNNNSSPQQQSCASKTVGSECPEPKSRKVHWTQPERVQYQVVEPSGTGPTIMNPMCQSLEILKLNVDMSWPKEELVPFLFKALPNVRCLGEINVLKGLRMMKAIPEIREENISVQKLEHLEFGSGSEFQNAYFPFFCVCVNDYWAVRARFP